MITGKRGKIFDYIILKNKVGMTATFIPLGALIYNLEVPDKNGVIESVTAHPVNQNAYIGTSAYFGKICGRTSGRIADGKFSINGKICHIDKNEKDVTCLHGGFSALSEKIWDYTTYESDGSSFAEFTCFSPDGECGFPGDLSVKVVYELKDEENTLLIHYSASSSDDTLCNLTNHSYFNLSGNVKRSVLGEELSIAASRYTVEDERLIGISIEPVDNTFDFTSSKPIGRDVNDECLQGHITNGYDHCFIFDEANLLKRNVFLSDSESGRTLSVFTTYPTVVVYSCNYPSGDLVHGGKKIEKYDGVCLECQFMPNGVNVGDDSALLKKGASYDETTVYKFGLLK